MHGRAREPVHCTGHCITNICPSPQCCLRGAPTRLQRRMGVMTVSRQGRALLIRDECAALMFCVAAGGTKALELLLDRMNLEQVMKKAANRFERLMSGTAVRSCHVG